MAQKTTHQCPEIKWNRLWGPWVSWSHAMALYNSSSRLLLRCVRVPWMKYRWVMLAMMMAVMRTLSITSCGPTTFLHAIQVWIPIVNDLEELTNIRDWTRTYAERRPGSEGLRALALTFPDTQPTVPGPHTCLCIGPLFIYLPVLVSIQYTLLYSEMKLIWGAASNKLYLKPSILTWASALAHGSRLWPVWTWL